MFIGFATQLGVQELYQAADFDLATPESIFCFPL
jgi:hypothetical protein